MKTTTEEYKGFKLDLFICRQGFNQYNITITKFRYEGTRQEEYYFKKIDTYTNIKAKARKEARAFIDGLKSIDWASNGQLNNLNRPHFIKEPYGLPFELTEKNKFKGDIKC